MYMLSSRKLPTFRRGWRSSLLSNYFPRATEATLLNKSGYTSRINVQKEAFAVYYRVYRHLDRRDTLCLCRARCSAFLFTSNSSCRLYRFRDILSNITNKWSGDACFSEIRLFAPVLLTLRRVSFW